MAYNLQNPNVFTYAGNPNGYVLGNAGTAGYTAPDFCWDSTHNQYWICTTSGNVSTAGWQTVGNITPVTVASAATVNLGAQASTRVTISGTTTITSFGSAAPAGLIYYVTFSGALTLTYNATSMILPTGVSISTSANDSALFLSLGSGNWRCLSYQAASGSLSSNYAYAATLTSGTTWTTPSWTTSASVFLITLVGGGGGSGGVKLSSAQSIGVGGGGSGGVLQFLATGLSASTAYTIAIGAAGTAGAATGTSGTSGGTTSITLGSYTLSAGGGTYSAGYTSGGVYTSPGGAGGTNTTTGSYTILLNISGQTGATGWAVSASVAMGATGGSTPLGYGLGGSAYYGYGLSTPTVAAGFAATGYGAGGGGSLCQNSSTGVVGVAGTQGIIQIQGLL